MKYVKYSPWRTIVNASRDIREIKLAKACGYNVVVLSNEKNVENAKNYVNADIEIINSNIINLNDSMKKAKKLFVTIKNCFTLIPKTTMLKADVLSCHDLNSLIAGYIATRFVRKKPLLVYDSHEYELGRNKKRSNRKKRLIKIVEGFLIKKSLVTIVVNDSIADKLVEVYSLRKRPIVIRSTPEKWDIDENVITNMRSQICLKLGIDNDSFITMYHGNMAVNRGIEKHLEAVKELPNIYAVFMGNADKEYLAHIQRLADEYGISKRVLFLDAVRHSDIWRYVGAADVSIMAIPASCESYYYMLPNKFMESIQSLTPVIASDFPEIGSLVKRYGIGLLCDPNDFEDLVSKILEMKNNKKQYKEFKENLITAKEELCWEKEQKMLQKVFDEIEKELRCVE